MKQFKKILYLVIFGLVFFSCEKDNDRGMVIVGVKINRKYTTNPTVYMKAGTLTMPTGSYSWSKTQAGGEDGKATFENLAPGDYYFYAREYGSSSYVTGGVGVKVVSRSRQNVYEPTIELK